MWICSHSENIKEDIEEIKEAAQILSIDIAELCRDENVPSFLKPNQDIAHADIAQDEKHKLPRKSTIDQATDVYDESSESVFDALLRIFDDGNSMVKTTENAIMNNETQMKETVVPVRGTKRKRSDVSNMKAGKYQCICQQCDYETSTSRTLRIHEEAIHEGVRYPCDQCDYEATQKCHLKNHRKSKHK